MAEHTQNIDSVKDKASPGEVSPSSSGVAEQIRQCQMEAKDSIEQLEAQVASAKTVAEKMSCNLRVKALKILVSRLEGVCGIDTAMPTDEEVEWAKKLFGLNK